jgi:predicted acyltransferase
MQGAEAGTLTREVNAARYLDAVLMAPLLGPAWSVEGNDLIALPGLGLPALGAFASTLIGLLAAHWMSEPRSLAERISGLFAAGLALLALGNVWEPMLPVNKTLWTGSYAILMAGLALQVFAFGTWLVRQCGLRAWALPLQVAGANALFFYVLAQSIQRLLVYGRIRSDDGSTVRLKQVIYDTFFSGSLSNEFGSLLHAFLFLVVCYAVVLFLFRRRVFLKL